MEDCLPPWFSWFEGASCAASVMINLTLLYLIAFHTPTDLKPYRRVLGCNCILDLLFAVCSEIIQPVWYTRRLRATLASFQHVHIRDDVIFFTVNGALTSSLNGRFFMVAAYSFVLYLMIFAISIPFLYRYLAVCW